MKQSRRTKAIEAAKRERTPPPIKYAAGSKYAAKRAKQIAEEAKS